MPAHAVSARRRSLLRLCGLAALGPLLPFRPAVAADSGMAGAMGMHEHHHDHAAMANKVLKRSEATYRIPKLTLVRRDGAKVDFPEALDTGEPVLLNFIYTSCTAICPLTSQVFSHVQGRLRLEHDSATLVSISIDPEHDTPARLVDYAKKFHAGDEWQYYTGTVEASIAMQKAFDVYRGDKMNHAPVTFLRAAPGKPWVRIEGFAGPEEILAEYHQLVKGS